MLPSQLAPMAAADIDSVQRQLSAAADLSNPAGLGRVAFFLPDQTQQRLLSGLAERLGLHTDLYEAQDLLLANLLDHELILADEAAAEAIRKRLADAATHSDVVPPAVVSIVTALPEGDRPWDGSNTATVSLAQDPAAVLAQLSVILYAHRAFSRRYQGAMEELHLNRRIFNSVTSGISIADATQPDMPLTYVNPAFELMTGYSLESVVGRNCRFLQRDEIEQPGLTVLRDAIKQRRQVTVMLRNYRKDGTVFWNELFMSPIRNREGELTHFVGIQNDVSARMEFEAALRQSEKLAAVGRLAASIAHEINNPLESVMNLLYLAQAEQDPAMVKHYVQEADNEVKRIAIITTQSLRFYRQNTRPRAIDCDDLLTSVLDLYVPKLSRFNIATIHTRRAHAPVLCMESEIRQVISNIVRNAIDAMRANTGKLEVRTRIMTDWKTDQRGIAMTIADTGSGIPPEVVKKLYTAFFTTKGDAGTGLGLWVSANIVERHNGRMLVRSSEHPQRHGTVFTVFLPFDGVQEAEQSETLALEPATA